MKRTALFFALASIAAAFTVAPERGAQASPNAPASTPRLTFTATRDARACTPLDKGGFAVATGGGLVIAKPDGSVQTLTSLDGLPETRVHAVVQRGDTLWVGTEGGTATVALENTPRVMSIVHRAPIHAIFANDDSVYLGTWGGGVLRIARGSTTPERVASKASGTRVASLAMHDGKLYAAYADGPLAVLEGGSLRDVAGTAVHGQSLASVATDDGPKLMFGALEGLYRVEKTIAHVSSVDARAIAVSGTSILVGTYGSGLVTSSIRGAMRTDTSVDAKHVLGVGIRGNARCVATDQGVYVDGGSGTFKKLVLDGPPSNDVAAISANGDRVFVGTFDHGAAIWNGARFDRVKAIADTETVNTAAWSGSGASATLWIGTAHGLYRVDPSGKSRRFSSTDGLPNSLVRAILPMPNGEVAIGTEEGAAFLNGDRVTPIATKKGASTLASPMHATWAIARREDGTLFFGTSTGLYWGKDGSYERASLVTKELDDDWVTALAVSGSDVFVGTYAKGVVRLRFHGEAKRPASTRLGGGYVNPEGLTLANGHMYAATMDGLLARNAADDRSTWEALHGAATGRDVTAARVIGSSLWVASRRGIAVSSIAD